MAYSARLSFGLCEIDLRREELHRRGRRVALQGRPFRLLEVLLERPGELVTRSELQKRLWPSGTFVEFEDGLNHAVKKLRDALGDSAENPLFIETVPRRGYRFIAPVERVGPDRRRRALLRASTLSIVLVGAVAIWAHFGRRLEPVTPSGGPAEKIRLAVLPFVNLSEDPEQDYFSDGLTEEMINQLARLRPEQVGVIASTTTMRYRNTAKTARQIGHELGIDFVLEGTVRSVGERVRITAQLIQVRDETHLWAETYEGDLRDVLELQNQVSHDVARGVQITLTPDTRAGLGQTRPVDPDAYRFYLKGRYFWNKRTEEGFEKALEYFEKAIRKDPVFAPAHAGLADTYALLGAAAYELLPVPEATRKAKESALRALEIDDTIAEAHAALAFVAYSYEWDWATAEHEFRSAVALNPSYATAHQSYSEYLIGMGRWEQALEHANEALSLDPLSLIIHENAARPYYFSRQFDEAIQRSQKTLEMDPNFSIAHLRIGRAYAAKDEYAKAIHHLQRFTELTGGSRLALASIGNALARSGDRQGAQRVLDELEAVPENERVGGQEIALVYLGLGQPDQAFEWLESSCSQRSDLLVRLLKMDPIFDPLRSDARFEQLLRCVGLPS